ncbi:hypothetical protein GGX14DRAFT_662040, partial [Mycena pura]
LGVTWPTRFKKRRPDLKVKWTTSLEECRARALNRATVHDYFDLLGDTIKQYDIQPKNIWNMDEKGIQLGVGDKIKALVDRDQKSLTRSKAGTATLSPSSNVSPQLVSRSIPLSSSRGSVAICAGGRTTLARRASPFRRMAGRIKNWGHCGLRRTSHRRPRYSSTTPVTTVCWCWTGITATAPFTSWILRRNIAL